MFETEADAIARADQRPGIEPKMPPKPKPRSRPPKWNPNFELMYGFTVAERAPGNGAVVSVKCLHCEFIGREDVKKSTDGRKRARTANTKYLKAPFRSDNIKAHLKSQHGQQWAEYKALGDEEKKTYFDRAVPIANTLRAHFEGEQELIFTVESGIVEVLISDFLFDPEAEDAIRTRDRALRFFTVSEKAGSESGSCSDDSGDDDVVLYNVSIKSARLFHLIVKFVARCASFRMATGLAHDVKEVTNMSCFVGASEERVAHFVRVVCASNLQIIGHCLQRVWAFGIALDVGSKDGTSYLDIRARFCLDGKLRNLHLLAIPLHEGKTASAIFSAETRMLDVLAPRWKTQLTGISTDGEPTMTGAINGVATQLQQATDQPSVKVWRGLHQLDIKVQKEYLRLHDEAFVGFLTAMISYLRRQFNLFSSMGTTCPKFMSTRWCAMKIATSWIKAARVVICQYFEDKEAACDPPLTWWVLMLTLDSIATEITAVVRRLQGLKTLLQEFLLTGGAADVPDWNFEFLRKCGWAAKR